MDVQSWLVGGVVGLAIGWTIAVWMIRRKARIQAGWKEEFREGLESAIEDLPVPCVMVSGDSFKVGQAVYVPADGEVEKTPQFIGKAIEDSVPIPGHPDGHHTVKVLLYSGEGSETPPPNQGPPTSGPEA